MACRDSCSAGSAGLLKSHPRHKKGLLRICFRTYSLFSHAVRALTTRGRIDRGSSKLRCRPRGNPFNRNCSWGGYILMISSHSFAKSLKRSALTVALGMCFVGAAIAAETGGLRITISGSDGQPIPGATVSVSSPDSLVSKTAVTAADGSVRLTGLDPATNYTVVVDASGYGDFSANNVAVVSGKNLSLGYALGATTLDTVVVTGTSLAAVDTTSAVVGTTLNLDIVESLPTGRTYQSYLQLVPGVKPSVDGNPSSKSGVNYSDVGGDIGISTDNVYYLDGVNVTDPLDGVAGANFNSEIIQEQQVLTGGIPAEYAGGAGLVSKVVTKSGGDEFHGSVNYYLQNDSLVSDDKHGQSARSEEHTSELQSLMRTSYAVFCLKKKKKQTTELKKSKKKHYKKKPRKEKRIQQE